MGQIFSRRQNRAGGGVTDRDKAILKLKVTRDKVRQYQKKIERVIERETQLAREALRAGKKQQALCVGCGAVCAGGADSALFWGVQRTCRAVLECR